MTDLIPIHAVRSAEAVTNTLAVVVDATPEETRAAVRRVDVAAPMIRALQSLGLSDRVTKRPDGLRFGVGAGHVDIAVATRVDSPTGERSTVVVKTTFRPSDAAAGERLRDAWPAVDALAAASVRRAVAAIKDHAEDDHFDSDDFSWRERRAS